ncbi:MAG: PRD domain-containing protein [Chloroflexi bacterium]|nr:PRD domain-containing protein [Chloroflexota bacterium]
MMSLSTRQCAILRILLDMDNPISMSEIASQLEITPRMVRYDFRGIERWLQARDVQLIKKANYGVFIEAPREVRIDLIRELEHLAGYHLILSPTERLHILILSLLKCDQPLLIKQLEPRLGVSRPTVLSDMNKAEKWLEEHNLSLIRRPHFGFKTVGKEGDWRKAVVDFLLETVGEMPLLVLCKGSKAALRSRMKGKVGLLRVLSAFFENLDLSYSKKLVDSIERMLHLQFTDDACVSLVLHLAILIGRVGQGKIVELPPQHLKSLREQREFHAAKIIADQIEQRFNTVLPKSEVAYIAIQLAGAKIRWTVSDIIGERSAEEIEPGVLEMVDGMLAEASIYLHPYLRVDQQLIRSLAFHLKPVLSRLRFGLPVRNPLLEDVKRQYPYIFKVARRSSDILEEKVSRRIPEEEIGYIAMHLGAAMERLRPFPGVKRRVLVICGEGVATAWLLVSKMQAEFPEVEVVEVMSTSEVSRRHVFRGDIDAMISTVPVEIVGIPIIVVSPLLGAKDKARIREVLKIGVSTSEPADNAGEAEEPCLATLITTETIRLRVAANNWQEVVDKAGRLLLNTGAIEARYIEAMKNIIVKYGPYIVIWPGIALLHARPEDGVKRLCMSLVTMQSSVKFGHLYNDPVDLVIALGAVDDRSHLKALAQLAEILGDQEMVNEIKSASAKKEILELVSGTPQKSSVMPSRKDAWSDVGNGKYLSQ